MLKVKRIYEEYSRRDGFRVFVDRLWARGMKKEQAHINRWLKEIAPSTSLRRWFNHDPVRWKEFRTRYLAELKSNPAADLLRQLNRQHATLTILYSAKDEQYNNARVLKEFLEKK